MELAKRKAQEETESAKKDALIAKKEAEALKRQVSFTTRFSC